MLEDNVTIDELAAFLKLRPQTIYRWAQSGKIPGAKFGKEWRFRRSAIERWLESYIPIEGSPGAVMGRQGGAKVERKRGPAPESEAVSSAAPATPPRRRGTKGTKKKGLRGPEAN